MPLSANTLIHFTASKEKLKQILQENFRVFNCKESVSLEGQMATYYVPMVSFCDIPLSEIKEHISKYGCYGLGMTKEWGMRKGLNPVLYVAQGSMLSSSYLKAVRHFNNTKYKEIDDWYDGHKALMDIARYLKNYEADLIRSGETILNYRYSDEREWRYVPPYTENCDMLHSVGESDEEEKNKILSDAKLHQLRLEFEPNDIKYIIINDDSEIREFVDHLRCVKGKNYTLHDVDRLTTRILTTEQIKSDM